MKLPEHIERDYMRLRASIVRQVGDVADEALHLRNDAADDPDLVELLALLGLTAKTVINRKALRARLRRIATRISDFERAQLTSIIGRYVHKPHPLIIDSWVDEQTEAITKSAETLLDRAAVSVGGILAGSAAALVALNQLVTPEEARVGVAASSAALALNARIVQSIATAAGSTHYRWITEDDDVVRENHAPLHFTVQAWANAPAGGGTKPEDSGHPGEGFGCRCIAEPVAAPTNPA